MFSEGQGEIMLEGSVVKCCPEAPDSGTLGNAARFKMPRVVIAI